jgi:hypothetical protein
MDLFKNHGKTKVGTTLWVVGILSVLLLFIQLIFTTHITSYSPTDLGLLSKLPYTFWLGIAILGALLYLGRNSRRRTVIVVILISFCLVAIPVLIRENKAEGLGISYYFASLGTGVLSNGHLMHANLDPWDLRNWPGFYLSTAIISSVTGLSATVLADYFPLLTMALLGIIIFSILRLKLNIIYSSLGALWFVASFWTGQHYYSPQSFAYLIFFAVFLIFAKMFFSKTKKTPLLLCIVLLFTAAVITHLLTSFFIIASIVALYTLFKILRQRFTFSSLFFINLILLLVVIFFIYQTIFIPDTFSTLGKALWGDISAEKTHLGVIAQGRAGGSLPLRMAIAGTYSLTIINAMVAVIAVAATAIGILFRKKKWQVEVFWVAWIISAGVLGVSITYGGEALNRALMFMLIPVSYFAMKFLSKKPRILVVCLMILIVLYFPARYSSEYYVYAPTTELEGVSFYTYHAPSNATLLNEYLVPFGPPLGPEITGQTLSIANAVGLRSLPTSNEVSYWIGRAQYITYSNELRNFYLYFYGVDLLENVSSSTQHRLLYDNGDFKVYSQFPNSLDLG